MEPKPMHFDIQPFIQPYADAIFYEAAAAFVALMLWMEFVRPVMKWWHSRRGSL